MSSVIMHKDEVIEKSHICINGIKTIWAKEVDPIFYNEKCRLTKKSNLLNKITFGLVKKLSEKELEEKTEFNICYGYSPFTIYPDYYRHKELLLRGQGLLSLAEHSVDGLVIVSAEDIPVIKWG